MISDHSRLLRVAVLLATSGAWLAQAQDWEARVRGLRPAVSMLGEKAVLDELEARAWESLHLIRHAADRQEADAARQALRRKLRESLGFEKLPWPPALNARRVGVIQRDGYRIEKTVYEGLPGSQIPAHLYLPAKIQGRVPGILFYPGHWWPDSKTRPDFQTFCINMARLGFAVLSWDPFGQGERGISSRDHRRVASLLVGIAQQGFAEYETRCALEYLLSRPEVDPRRIGMTGASGGGYNTWITAALDDRISAAVPVVGTSEFYEQIRVTRPLDWYHASEHCHFLPGLIRYANSHELLAMAAPKPLLIIAASEDQSFPIAGVKQVYGYGQQLYRSYGIPEEIGLFEDSSAGHGYQQKKREAAYGWFLRYLMGRGDGRPFPEPRTETPPFDAPELRCFPPGRNEPAGPGMIEAVRALAGEVRAREPWPPLPAGPVPRLTLTKERLQRLEIPVGGGLRIPAFLLRPGARERGVLVGISDSGKEALAGEPAIREAVARGWAVCGVDVRGIGEMATAQNGWVAAVSLLLGDSFVRRQAADLVTAVRAMATKPVALYARGQNAALAAALALADSPEVQWFIARDGFLSFRQFLERPESLAASYRLQREDKDRTTSFDREIPFRFIPFCALEHPDIAQLYGKRRGLVVNPINGDWQRVAAARAHETVPASVDVVSTDDPEQTVIEFVRRATE